MRFCVVAVCCCCVACIYKFLIFFPFRLFGCFRFYLTISISFDPLYVLSVTLRSIRLFRWFFFSALSLVMYVHGFAKNSLPLYNIYILVICMCMCLYVDRIFAMRLCLCQCQCQCLYLTQYQNSIWRSGSIRSAIHAEITRDRSWFFAIYILFGV